MAAKKKPELAKDRWPDLRVSEVEAMRADANKVGPINLRARSLELAIQAASVCGQRGMVITGAMLTKEAEEIEKWLKLATS